MRKAEKPGTTTITAKDIGKVLGLSQPTVSRILSGASGHRVSPEARRRVLEAAESMGYRPNAIARSLRRRRTDIVGFYTGYNALDARNAFLAETLGGLQRACNRYRMDLLLHSYFHSDAADDIYGELMDGRIDGLLLHTHAGDPLAARLENTALPAVALADAIPGVPSVVADSAGGVRLLVDRLWNQGHRRIGYIRPTIRLDSVEERVAAFEEMMAQRGMTLEECPIFEIEIENAEPALDAILSMPSPPTAVCCWNDLTALHLINVCRRRGVRIPEDLAVVGFDGLFDPRLTSRALTTVGPDWGEVTGRAMDLLVEQIHRRQRRYTTDANEDLVEAEMPMRVQISVRLIEGDTV